jgi:hypothetical protein
MSAAETLWAAVLESDIGQEADIDTTMHTETALLKVLPAEAPRCLGKQMHACGNLHGCQTGNQRHLLVTSENEDWSTVSAQLRMGLSSVDNRTEAVEHAFEASCEVDWSPATGVGTATVPDGTHTLQGGRVPVQVRRDTVLTHHKQKKRPLDRQWMWELLWAESMEKPHL